MALSWIDLICTKMTSYPVALLDIDILLNYGTVQLSTTSYSCGFGTCPYQLPCSWYHMLFFMLCVSVDLFLSGYFLSKFLTASRRNCFYSMSFVCNKLYLSTSSVPRLAMSFTTRILLWQILSAIFFLLWWVFAEEVKGKSSEFKEPSTVQCLSVLLIQTDPGSYRHLSVLLSHLFRPSTSTWAPLCSCCKSCGSKTISPLLLWKMMTRRH